MSRATADSEKSLRGIPRAVLALPSIWKPAIRESREARLEAALVFNKPSEELVDFFRVAACFLADFALKGPFLVFMARLFLNTYTVPIFFKLLKVVDLFDRATCFSLHHYRNLDSFHGVDKVGRHLPRCFFLVFHLSSGSC